MILLVSPFERLTQSHINSTVAMSFEIKLNEQIEALFDGIQRHYLLIRPYTGLLSFYSDIIVVTCCY
jgi:hypothetical protein